MSDIQIRTEGRAGRITLTRPKALNALTYAMCTAIEEALDRWRNDDSVALVLLDAEGDKAFCAGGDIAEMYRTGTAGDYGYARRFWRDEYRLNAKLAAYPKPIVAFLQGFTMGGGVGLGGHVSHRITGESSQVSMPECGIGFVPDVGGTYRLARAPGRLGAYLGLTAARMGPGDAIHAGFADSFVPEARWPDLKARLVRSGDPDAIAAQSDTPPDSPLAAAQPEIDADFAGTDLPAILDRLQASGTPLAQQALKAMGRNAPLSMATTLRMLDRLGPDATIRDALELEYRVSHRIMEQGDFLEGIRAAIIDKDRSPRWRHGADSVPAGAVEALLAPLGPDTLTLEED
ncbi:enoyl-CoA hydratase/isomerase family protein [Ponticoccus sp. (in: a-proteobacteria)]|uniref:enoyl-CoA hydratase/isomerase family protein n=1 Tax=Ponticoccus sp. (in: a-proteobacteria) TaxID=1925025 RepID=UPI003AB7B907